MLLYPVSRNDRGEGVRVHVPLGLALALSAASLLSCGDSTGPSWSDDCLPVSGEILFFSDRSGAGSHLYIVNSAGTESLPQLAGESLIRDASWSHDGGTIAYTVERRYGEADYGSDIYLLERSGAAGWPLVTSQGSDREPRWSPDDARIAFLSQREGPGPGVYVINADGTEEIRVIAGHFPDDWGSWSPDGQSLVVTAVADTPMCVVDLATGEAASLGVGYGPAFSPDGGWIAYHNRGIHLIKPDGSEPSTLTSYGDDFRWNPQGDYVSFRDSNPYTPYTLELISVDGKDHAVLVEYAESWRYIRHHSWSPDGDYIAYSVAMTLENTQSAIFVVNVNEGTVERVTHYPGPDGHPEWRPGP